MIEWLSAPADLTRLDVCIAFLLFFFFVCVDIYFALRFLFVIQDYNDRNTRIWMTFIDRTKEAKR